MTARLLIRLAVAVVCLAGSAGAFASGVEYARVSRANAEVVLEIRLDCTHSYTGHRPVAAAREVTVSLARAAGCAGAARASVRPDGGDMAGLDLIDYDAGDSSEARLRLRFRSPATLQVWQIGDRRLLRVKVMVEPTANAAVAPASPPATPKAMAALDPAQQARVESRLRKVSAPDTTNADERGSYAINLLSSTQPPALQAVPGADLTGRQLYVTRLLLEGNTWHFLRLGFFSSESAAEQALLTLRGAFPNAWALQVNPREAEAAAAGNPATEKRPTMNSSMPVATGLSPEQAATVMAEARTAMLARDYGRAIPLYMQVLALPRNEHSQSAREFLGLAFERTGNPAAAADAYGQYLADYPDGDDAARVRQRLVALTTARDTPRQALRTGDRRGNSGWTSAGSFSQYYRREAGDYEDDGFTTKASLVQSDGDLTLRRAGARLDLAARATVGYDYDLTGGPAAPGNRTRVYNLFADLTDRRSSFGARIGRQTERRVGALGRYDGAHLYYRLRPDLKLNLMGGFPVYRSSASPESDRRFLSLGLDVDSVADRIDTSFYATAQEVDGIDDRTALGTEFRYFDDARSLVGLIDYDVGFGLLNTLSAIGNWILPNGLTINASADYRRSPFALIENALIGQSARTVDELLESLTEDQVRDLAEDRSGEMLTYTVGLSRALGERWEVNADFIVLQIAEGPGSGGVLQLPDSGTEYYLDASIVGSSLLRAGDVSIVGLRYSDSVLTQDTALYFDSRFPISRNLRVNPRLTARFRQIEADDSSEWRLTPAIRLICQFGEHYEIELEGGGDIGSRNGDVTYGDASAYYIYAGYRADF